MLRSVPLVGAACAAALVLALPSAAPAAVALDPGFDRDGVAFVPGIRVVTEIAPTADGGVVAVGYDRGPMVARLGGDGAPVRGFGDGGVVDLAPIVGNGTADGVAVDAAGRVVAGTNGAGGGSVVRLLADGTRDRTFGDHGKVSLRMAPDETSSGLSTLAITPGNGIVVVGGHLGGSAPGTDVVRLDAWGTLLHRRALDVSTGPTIAEPPAVAVSSSGHVAISGRKAGEAMLRRLTPELLPAAPFPNPMLQNLSRGGGSGSFRAVAVDPAGGIHAVGLATETGAVSDGAVFSTGPDGGARHLERTPGPDGASLVLNGIGFEDGARVVGGVVSVPGELGSITSSAFAFLDDRGRVDPARGGLQRLALPAAYPKHGVGPVVFDGRGHGFQQVEIDVEGVGRPAVLKVDLDPPVAPGPDAAPAPAADVEATPGPGATPAPAPRAPSERVRFAPVVRLAAPGRGPIRSLRGTADAGTRRVEVAIARRSGKRCRAITATSGRLGRAGVCAPTRWLVAAGTRGWRLKLRRALPRGGYVAWVRAVGEPGATSRPLSATAGNQLAFRVRR